MEAAQPFAAGAMLISLIFALCTLERWLDRRRDHELAWTISLFCFAAGSAALLAATANGWTSVSFRVFYLFGGILTVPALAVGTVSLLGRRQTGRVVGAVVALMGAFSAGVIATAPMKAALTPDGLNSGREVFGIGPRILAATGSGVGATVVFAGALWSALRLIRSRGPGSGRLAIGNLLIALGVLALSVKLPFSELAGEVTGFALALMTGILLIFGGFLVAGTRRRRQRNVVVDEPPSNVHPISRPA